MLSSLGCGAQRVRRARGLPAATRPVFKWGLVTGAGWRAADESLPEHIPSWTCYSQGSSSYQAFVV